MTPPLVERIIASRSLMWLLLGSYFILFLIADAISSLAGDVVLVVGILGLGAAFAWSRPRSGRGSISTRCEKCQGSLQGVAGLPRSTCPSCAHRQSWARSR